VKDQQSSLKLNQALTKIDQVEGWLTTAQAVDLWNAAKETQTVPGEIVEIGSYRGRSTIVLASAANLDKRVTAIDPHAGSDRGPQEILANHSKGSKDFEAFHNNLKTAGVDGKVTHLRATSDDALAQAPEKISLLYIDGAHRYKPAKSDITQWSALVSPGGLTLIHDEFCSIGVTLATVRTLLFSRQHRYIERTGSLAKYQRVDIQGKKRLINVFKQLKELPWFCRNLLVKVGLVLKIKPLVKVLRHRTNDWPY